MQKQSVEIVVRSLNEAAVRYLIVGGLAVVAHGYVRFTADFDLLVQLDEKNLRSALTALARLGYRPRAPVAIEEFADPTKRQMWIKEKGMAVFSLFSPQHPATEIDLFTEMPFDFDSAYAACAKFEIFPGLSATFIDLERLLAMKTKVGRPRDILDVGELKALKRDLGHG